MSDLNLDLHPSTDVLIGGRVFKITEQSRPMLQRILAHVNGEIASEELKAKKKGEEPTLTELMFHNFDASLPAIAMILGCEDLTSTEGKELVQHLHNHLHPSGAIKIYEEWWLLNDLDSFFLRGGRPLLMKELVESIKKSKETLAAEVN